MTKAAKKKVINATVNGRKFIAHLREMFSTKTTFIGELMQNARRAGSTSVHFEIEQEEGNGDSLNIIVTDAGCGVDNMASLIAVAESDWDEAAMAAEEPFGMGFMSVVFVASAVSVESKGQGIHFTPDDIIHMKDIKVVASDFIGGTRVTLKGIKQPFPKIYEAITDRAKGFAIDVYCNGKMIESPHRAGTMNFVDTPIGKVHIPFLHCDSRADSRERHSIGVQETSVDFIAYCQGLPVTTRKYGTAIVHLDHKRFKPRMPDREGLVDWDEAKAAVGVVIRECWRSFLQEMHQTLAPNVFATHYWKIAIACQCSDLLNNISIIPAGVMKIIDGYPTKVDWETGERYCEEDVTKEEIVSGAVLLVDESTIPEEHEIPIRMWLRQKNARLPFAIPKGHWAAPYIVDLSDAAPEIAGEIIATQRFSGCWCDGDLLLMRNLGITLLGETLPIDCAFADHNGDEVGDAFDSVFYIPEEGNVRTKMVLLQASGYRNGNDEFMETDLSLDESDFERILNLLKGGDPTEVIVSCLNQMGIRGYPEMRGKQFMLSIDDEGNLTVVANQ